MKTDSGSGGFVSLYRACECLQYGLLGLKILVMDVAFGIVSLWVEVWWRGA